MAFGGVRGVERKKEAFPRDHLRVDCSFSRAVGGPMSGAASRKSGWRKGRAKKGVDFFSTKKSPTQRAKRLTCLTGTLRTASIGWSSLG